MTCKCCPPSPLKEGTYKNATITVDCNGHIVAVHSGRAFVYTPQVHTVPDSGGNCAGGFIRGEKGEQGQAATVTLGTITMVASDAPARMYNTGTPQNAIINLDIPKGLKGEDAIVAGYTGQWKALEIEKGLVKSLDPAYVEPDSPIDIQGSEADDTHAKVVVDTSPIDGTVTIECDVSSLVESWNGILQNLQDTWNETIQGVENRIAALTERVEILEQQLTP